MRRDEFEFANDVRAAMEERSPRTAWIQIAVIALVLVIAVVWARLAMLDEVTHGLGRIIPSSQVQVVQTLEGGIVREILVSEGDMVEKDQPLVRIDDINFLSKLGELRQTRYALRAEILRLEAEAAGAEEMASDSELEQAVPHQFEIEREVFKARRTKLTEELAILDQQLVQKEQELRELAAKKEKLAATAAPLAREVDLTRALQKRGVVPEVDMLRLERQQAEVAGEIAITEASIPRAEAAISEVKRRISTAEATFMAETRERLAKARGEYAVTLESERAANDRVVRTMLRSPVKGIVNKVNLTTIGAVAQPGFGILDIVPLDDTLLVETRIRPKDVAFIRPKQRASIKLTAYDYLLYGTLGGEVERISADTLSNKDEKNEETFYRVMVRTDRNYVERNGEKLPIIPGMVANVDILTGRKTVFDYIIKPLSRIATEAFRER